MQSDDGTAVHAWNAGFHDLSRIFAPLASLRLGFEAFAAWPEIDAFNAVARRNALRNAAGMPLSFVPAAPKPRRSRRSAGPPALSYEQQVFTRGEVPTRRHSWHDYFNMMVWNLLPRTKAALNARQVAETSGDRTKTRTREQDRLAMFDEGGAIAVMPHGSLPEGLATSGSALAPPWLVVAGHAVYESVVVETRDIRLFTLLVGMDAPFFAKPLAAQLAAADDAAAQIIGAGGLALDGSARMTGILLSELAGQR